MVQKSSLIILTRNEAVSLKALINTIPLSSVDETLAVDYKSTDGTVDLFKKHKIRVIAQEKPGRGEAFRLAARHSKGSILIFFSPDGNEDPADIPNLIKLIKNGADMAIASRFMKGARNEEDDQVIKLRKWANQAFTLIVNLMWRGSLTDSINGYRAITKKAFNELHLDADGFAIEYQMSIRALKKRLKMVEIPTREGNRIAGKSGSWAIPTGISFIRYLIREVFRQ